MSKLVHAFVIDLSNIALIFTVITAIYLINPQLAFITAGLLTIRSVAKVLYSLELKKEDDQYMELLNKMLKEKVDKQDN